MKRANRSRLVLSWLLSYLFILVMPILISSFVYSRANETIDDEVASVNRASLKQLQSVMDGSFTSFERIVGSLSLNNDVRMLLAAREDHTGKWIQTILRVQDVLAGHQLTDQLIDEIFLYVDQQQIMVTSTYKYNLDAIVSSCRQKFGMDYEDFVPLLKQKHPQSFRITGEEGQKHLLFLSPLYAYGYSRPAGLLVIRLKDGEFSRMLNITGTVNDADLFVVNALGEWYGAGYEKLGEQERSFHAASEAAETYELPGDQGGLTVARIASSVVDAEIVSLISTDVYHQKSFRIRRIMRVYVLVCLLLGGCAAVLFTRINYSPVLRLRRMLASHNKSIENATDEYRLLESTLTELLSGETEMKKLTVEKTERERNAMLTQILLGRVSYDGKAMAEVRGRFIADSFAVITLVLSPDHRAGGDFRLEDRETVDLVFQAIRELGESIFGNLFSVIMTEAYGEPVFILNGDAREPQVFSVQVTDCVRRLVEPLQKSFSLVVRANISSLHEGHSALADAYAETRMVQEYRHFMADSREMLSYDEISSQLADEDLRMISLTQQRLFMNCLESSDYENAGKILSGILNREVATYHAVRLLRAQVMIYAGILVNRVMSSTPEEAQNAEPSHLEELLEEVLTENSASGLREKARELFTCAVAELKSLEQAKIPRCVPQAEQYVLQHYTDPTLNVAAIADALSLNASYLSRTYKKYRGMGLLDYIHRRRLDKAKELINEMSVANVATQVGYTDSKALINAFKRYEGTTPGKFRH